MRPLWLDYQRAAPGRRRPGVLLLIAGLVATGLTSAGYFSVAAGLEEAQNQVSKLKREALQQRASQAALAASPGAREPDRPSHTAARWEALFASLEAASDDSVTLLALRPGASEVQISGEAKDFAASLDYVKRIQAGAALANAHLTQSELILENPQHPVRFALAAQWRSAPP